MSVLKIVLIVSVVVCLIAVGLVAFLLIDTKGSDDQTIRKVVSPDGRLAAELHQIVTRAHGGPDTLYVSVGTRDYAMNEVYSRVYECTDYSAFQLIWQGSNELTIKYASCDSGYGAFEAENVVQRKDSSWRDVKINYVDTRFVARH